MNFAHYIKEIGRGAEGARDLTCDEARQLYGAMLDGGVPDLELGAIVLSLRVKGESASEMRAFMAATDDRVHALRAPAARPRPVILPSYNGARKSPNLTPLLALLLRRYGVPVLVHGLLEGFGRVTSASIFRELEVPVSLTPTQAQRALDESGLVFVPLPALAPGLANLLALRGRLGVRNSAHSLCKMLDFFRGQGVVTGVATHPAFIDLMREIFLAEGKRALLLRATEGEPYANPRRRPRIEYLHEGQCETLFEAEHDSLRALPHLPDSAEAVATAQWIRRVLDNHLPLPLPIANQLAACLYASGAARDVHEAKAMVSVEACGITGGSGF